MLLQIPKNSLDIYGQIRDMTSEFAREEIRPHAEKLDRVTDFPSNIFKQMTDLWRQRLYTGL